MPAEAAIYLAEVDISPHPCGLGELTLANINRYEPELPGGRETELTM